MSLKFQIESGQSPPDCSPGRREYRLWRGGQRALFGRKEEEGEEEEEEEEEQVVVVVVEEEEEEEEEEKRRCPPG
jgi:hypothetical protein